MLSQPQYSTQLFFLDETLLKACGNSKLSTLANFYGEKAEVTFEGVTYSSLASVSKEELLGEWPVFKSCFPREEGYDGKNISSPSLQDIKDTMETSYACMLPETF